MPLPFRHFVCLIGITLPFILCSCDLTGSGASNGGGERTTITVEGTVTGRLSGRAIFDATVELLAPEGTINPTLNPLDTDTTEGDGQYRLVTAFEGTTPDSLLIRTTRTGFGGTETSVRPKESIARELQIGPRVIEDVADLREISSSRLYVDGEYVLANDIDAAATSEWNGGKGFDPIGGINGGTGGFAVVPFSGIFNGRGHEIKNLTIDRGGTGGMFGILSGRVENLILSEVDISGGGSVGGLAGSLDGGTVHNVKVSGEITGGGSIGGIAGRSSGSDRGDPSVLRRAQSDARVHAEGNEVGGLVGVNAENSAIVNSASTSHVTGEQAVGGLVGMNFKGHIRTSKATGLVEGEHRVGGLVGEQITIATQVARVDSSYARTSVECVRRCGGFVGLNNGIVQEVYSGSEVSGKRSVGGLVGWNEGKIRRAYSEGDVSGELEVGGLIGRVASSDSTVRFPRDVELVVQEGYAVGSVEGTQEGGGMIGADGQEASFAGLYWDERTTGADTGIGNGSSDSIEPLSTPEMTGEQAPENLDGFDFEHVWRAVSGNYPALGWE